MRKDKTKLSITDIASRFSVSVTTISFILNGKAPEKKISASLTRRVEDYVKRVGYVPSSAKKKTEKQGFDNLVAILTDDFTSVSLLKYLRQELEQHDKHVLIVPVDAEELVVSTLLENGVGVFLSLIELSAALLGKIKTEEIVVVLMGQKQDFFDTIDFDYQSAAQEAVRMLLSRKRSRVGLITVLSSQTMYKFILNGYMQAMDEVGADWLIKKMNPELSKAEQLSQLDSFILENRLDAVFFAQESYAMLALSSIKSLGQEVYVASFVEGDLLNNLYERPVLIQFDKLELAKNLSALLIKRCAQKTGNAAAMNLSFELIA